MNHTVLLLRDNLKEREVDVRMFVARRLRSSGGIVPTSQ